MNTQLISCRNRHKALSVCGLSRDHTKHSRLGFSRIPGKSKSKPIITFTVLPAVVLGPPSGSEFSSGPGLEFELSFGLVSTKVKVSSLYFNVDSILDKKTHKKNDPVQYRNILRLLITPSDSRIDSKYDRIEFFLIANLKNI